jgi:MoaA/NifB/PqqE/SkfB family radical SAM enzyme
MKWTDTHPKKYRFDIAISSYCQAKCPSCARTDEETLETVSWLKPSHIDVEVFKNIVDSACKIDPNVVFQFCGELGDPLMHPKITELVDYAMERAKGVEINTNGGLRKPEWYEDMAKKWGKNSIADRVGKTLKIIFGIDGIYPETNEKYRINVDHERAMKNMKAWSEGSGAGEWHFILFEHNWHEIPEAILVSQQIDFPIFFKFNGRDYGMISDHGKKEAYRLIEKYDGEIVP